MQVSNSYKLCIITCDYNPKPNPHPNPYSSLHIIIITLYLNVA